LCGAVSHHGVRAADLPRELARYRGVPGCASGQAVPHGHRRWSEWPRALQAWSCSAAPTARASRRRRRACCAWAWARFSMGLWSQKSMDASRDSVAAGRRDCGVRLSHGLPSGRPRPGGWRATGRL